MRLIVLASTFLLLFTLTLSAQHVSVGSGSYSTVLPAGRLGPSFSNNNPAIPKVSAAFDKPPQTNEFWSSLIFPFFGNPHSNNLHAHPATFRAVSGGLEMGYAPTYQIVGSDYVFRHGHQMVIGVAGLNADSTLTDDYGDWTVTASWNDGQRSMQATIGHGLPFAFFNIAGGAASIQINGAGTIWHNQNGVIGISIDGRHYGIFAPHNSVWTGTNVLQSTLNNQNYLSVAVLPDNQSGTLEFFRKRAYAHVTDSRVDWSYDENTMMVTTTFTYDVDLKENLNGNLAQTLSALYRHQWKYTDAPLTSYRYNSRAGQMKLYDGNTFTTRVRFDGVLPSLPDLGDYNRNQMLFWVRSANSTLRPIDTYNSGKEMGRMARVVHIADQRGAMTERNQMLNKLKQRLQIWLTAGGDQQYVYNDTWRVLTGYPASHGSDREINDHGFHSGYAIMAAATIAQYDPEWASQDRWGGMINMLIRDANNWERHDTRFPFLRGLNPYAGHSWAAGHGDFADGNNQESSSESMHFASAVVLWGVMTGQTDIRDLGAFLHATERTAVEQYWFDVDREVFPNVFPHTTVGIVWGGKGTYNTWFGSAPQFIHGINFLPITGGSLYLGRHPDYVLRNVTEIVFRSGSNSNIWRDVIWNFLALADADRSMRELLAFPNYAEFDGESRAHTFHWISNLQVMGQLDTTVTANVATAAVFRNKDGHRTYVAFNAESELAEIRFSDNYILTVEGRTLGHAGPISDEPVSIQDPEESVAGFRLHAAYPNPFNPSATIRFELAETATARLEVYSVTGKRVATLVDDRLPAGVHSVDFDASALASGVYMYRLSAGGTVITRKMTLLK